MVEKQTKQSKPIDAATGWKQEADKLRDTLEELTADLAKHEKSVEKVNAFMVGVVIALMTTVTIIGLQFGDVLLERWKSKEASYQDLIHKIDQQSSLFQMAYERRKK